MIIILKRILESTVLIDFTHDRGPVQIIINLSAPYRAGNFRSS
jgi:hypothetical protein